jgi:hypothetical protein
LGQNSGTFNGLQYIEGRDDSVVFEAVSAPGDPRDCIVSIGGKECTSCDIIDCGGSFPGLDVECDNVEDGGSFNQCQLTEVESGALEFFSPSEFSLCVVPKIPLEFCEQQLEFAEIRGSDDGTSCSCEGNENGALLSCADTKCLFCNENDSVCKLDVAYGGEIGKYGFFVSSFDTTDFVVGRSERLVIEQSLPYSCRVTIDGQECQSCERVVCPGLFVELDIECGNVLAGAAYAGCSDSGSNIFESLTSGSFDVCVAYDGTFPPTAAPDVSTPTSPAADGPPEPSADDDSDEKTSRACDQCSKFWLCFGIVLQFLVLWV